ncbi:MAG: cellulase family glycosylhydrolase [Deltaproteobacteria bacterium]|nr:cellulase family glycosylhydrolase [Deltaproteobacteria bacterium]
MWVDGQGTDTATNYKLANVETSGSDAAAHRRPRQPTLEPGARRRRHPRARFLDERRRVPTSASCATLITGYPSRHEQDGLAQAQWVDGIAVHCEQATVQSNAIVDVTDSGVMLFGAYNRSLGATATQRSTVSGNTVVSAGLDARVALGADPIGECQAHRSGWIVPCLEFPNERSFAGASIASNKFWSGPRTSFDVGLLVGGAPEWGNHRVPGRGVSVTSNTTAGAGARVNMGISVLGMFDVTLSGNTASYTLVDGNPGVADGKCPLVSVGVGSSARASVRAGAQASTIHDAADGCLVAAPPVGGLERIVRKADGSGFMGATSGRAFVPWGMNYDQHIEGWWDADWSRLVSDFREMRRMGVNTVRVLLQTVRILNPPTSGYPNGTPNTAALAQVTRLVRLAEQTGLYLDITGLGIEDPAAQQAWYDDRDENGRWAAQERFWISVVQAVGASPAVAWFDLMNEPSAQAGPSGSWCAGLFGGYCYVQYLTDDAAGRTSVAIARAWMTRMKNAIRVTAGDTTHLISVGLLPYGYSGFRPSDVTDLEDFGTVHMYPRSDAAGTPTNELQFDIDSVKSFKPAGQPLVVEEMLNMNCSEADLETFVLGTRPEVGGWLGHYMTRPPAEITPPPTIGDAIFLDYYKMFLRDGFLVSPIGTGTLQP